MQLYFGRPGGDCVLLSPLVRSTDDVMDNLDKGNLGGGSTTDPGSCSSLNTSNNRAAFSVASSSNVHARIRGPD